MSLGSRVKIVRKYNKLNQRNFSIMLGLSQAHISNIETDKDKPSDKILKSICVNFNVNFEWLKNGTGDMNSPSTQPDYNQIVLEIKKRFAENDELTNIEINEILSLTINIIDKAKSTDIGMYKYNYIEKMLGIILEILNFIAENEEKNNYVTEEEIVTRIKMKDMINEKLNKIVEIMIM